MIERSVSSSERKINEGKLIRKSGKWVHQVLIPKWTPGLVVDSTDKSVDVSFKKGTNITFGADKKGRYGNYRVIYSGNSEYFNDAWYDKKTWYDKEIYHIVYEESEDCEGYKGNIPKLWIDSESFKKLKKERKILEGRTLPQD